ncbi:hypothetical protein L6R53_26960 [Myxococcota bacterium]|nr:hypothetical protein [Myxococcota bacterium]
MPIPDSFVHECLYAPEAWFIHDVLTLDPEGDRVVAWIDTTRLGPLVDAQRTWPGHDKHFPGAVAIQVTGTLGQLHAIYCMGLRASEGWIGFGTHVKKARFPSMGRIGPPATAALSVVRKRQLRGTWFVDYAFRYEQEGRLFYESEQTAAWGRTDHRGPLD